MGKPQTPVGERQLKGKAAGRDYSIDESKLDQLRPLSEWMVYGSSAKRAWYDRLSEIIPTGGYKETDGVILEALAEALVTKNLANTKLELEGHVLADDAGRQYINPWVAVRRDAVSQIAKFLPKLGLTPADRSKLVTSLPARSKSRRTKKMLTRDA